MNNIRRDIYRVFDPAPLRAEDDGLYVNLEPARGEEGAAKRLQEKIQLADRPTCQVLAGHKGSGKSTELYRLQRNLFSSNPKFFVVYCKADEDIDRNDVDFPEILIALVKQLARQVESQWNIPLRPGFFAKCFNRIRDFVSDLNLEKFEVSVGLAKIAGTMKSSPDARRKIRGLLEPDTNNLLLAANELIGEVTKLLAEKNFAGLVILVDDLDKMVVRAHDGAGCTTDEYLFVHRAAQLTALNCHVIYTMPLSLAYSHAESIIKSSFGGHVPVVPMTKVSNRPPQLGPYQEGIGLFLSVIEKRLKKAGVKMEDLFVNEEVAKELISLSGGQPSELMTLIREALITDMPIKERSLDRARKVGQREYDRQLLLEHWRILQAVRSEGKFVPSEENEAEFRELLNSRAILQYVNDEEWYGLNPMVAALKPPTQIQETP